MDKQKVVYDSYCNRCGQDMVRTSKVLSFFWHNRIVDLCPACAEEFYRFMEGGTVKKKERRAS